MIKGIRHTGLVVRDLERSLQFYENILGFEVLLRNTERGAYIERLVNIKDAVIDWIKLKAPDGSIIELLEYKNPSGNTTEVTNNKPSNFLGCSHIAITVNSIEELHTLFIKHKIHCNSKPLLSADRKVKVMYCHDPDGINIEFVEELL